VTGLFRNSKPDARAVYEGGY